MTDDSVTAAELDELDKRLEAQRDMGLVGTPYPVASYADALDAIRALRAANAKKDAALRDFIATLRLTGNGRDPMCNRSAIADELEEEILTPASQEADHFADAGKMVPASPAAGCCGLTALGHCTNCSLVPVSGCDCPTCVAEAPASPSPGLRASDAQTVEKVALAIQSLEDHDTPDDLARNRQQAKAALFALGWPELRAAVIEECAKVCEQQAQVFLSTDYAVAQPLSSLQERFACKTCADAIRALAQEGGK